ncbi:hypothetical protein A9Q81_19680 [Gammaproteobacteria bacterium 42_54_T18]|nr:hypothetical protein A9Q81_19680 [Gammaproteobacteria bacterium 42_54_T18]
MKKWAANLFLTTTIMLCMPIVGCQSGNQDTASGDDMKKEGASLPVLGTAAILTAPQQDALDAFNRGDKKLLGVQTRGVSVPGVNEALLPVLRERYGITLRHVTDVMKDQKDRDSIAEVFQYVRQYNEKMAELLSAEM